MRIRARKILIKTIFTVIACTIFGGTNALEKNEALFQSVSSGNLSEFIRLLQDGVDPNFIVTGAKRNWTMCEVTKKNNERFLVEAIKYGGDVNIRSESSSTASSSPLLCAIGHHNYSAVETLVASGAEISIEACMGCRDQKYSPTVIAAVFNEFRMVDFLLNVDVPKHTDMEELASMIATRPISSTGPNYVWRDKVVDLLRSHGLTVVPWSN